VKRAIILTVVALVGWQVYSQYRVGALEWLRPPQPTKPGAAGTAPASDFKCDMRTHCAQMTSCAEAKYFRKHCTDADLEIDDAGVPCPRRWCTSPNAP
jgi:predicted negative regulator of RcsB-dependent stress response